MARNYKRLCRECGSNATVIRTEHLHYDYKKEYCQCNNSQCQHRWVNSIVYEKTLKQSKLSPNRTIQMLVEKLSLEEIKVLQQIVNQQLEKS